MTIEDNKVVESGVGRKSASCSTNLTFAPLVSPPQGLLCSPVLPI